MAKAELKSFGKPDEVREFPKGRVELIKIGGATVGRAIFQPGWRWSTSSNHLLRQKVAKPLTSSITCRECLRFAWTTEPSSSASLAMCRCSPRVMTAGLSETSR